MSQRRGGGLFGELERLVSTVAKYLAYYTTAVKLAQLVPLLVGFAVVLFSPTAWLSATLRTYAFGAMAVGSIVGMGALGLLVTRGRDRREHAVALLALFLASAAVLRLHLATIDIAFVERWTVLRPFQDFYLGSDTGELVFNVVAAVWFAVTVFAATLGLPLYVKWRQASAKEERPKSSEADRVARVREAMDLVTSELVTLHQEVDELEVENRSLRRELERREARVEELQRELANRERTEEGRAARER